ncbi:hypothetical protein J2H06_004377 [Salmonella enterica]|nr:hypothetical protein [Salmonella enterica]
MDKTERERMLARRRQARRRERLRVEGVSVTVTLTHDEAAQLDEVFPAAADPQLATVGERKSRAGYMPALRKIKSRWRLRRGVSKGNIPMLAGAGRKRA